MQNKIEKSETMKIIAISMKTEGSSWALFHMPSKLLPILSASTRNSYT